MSEKHATGGKLWDEILKAIVDAMPEQLFPLFKEIYGKDYPKGTSITLLATESSTYQESPDTPPGSRLSDITFLVNGTDYYHLECQMHNDQDIVIRMIAYDLHFAMRPEYRLLCASSRPISVAIGRGVTSNCYSQ